MLAERLFPGEDPIGRRIAEANRIAVRLHTG